MDLKGFHTEIEVGF